MEANEITLYTQDGCRNCEEVKKRFPEAIVKKANTLADFPGGVQMIVAANGKLPIMEVDGIFWSCIGIGEK